MNVHWCRVLVLSIVMVIFASSSLLAQKYEIYPYAGGIWPDSSAVGKLKSQVIYGVKLGFFADPNIELDLNFGYLNHFEVTDIDPKSRGILWEVGASYNFSAQEFAVVRQFTPYFAAGVGGITTRLKDIDSFTFNRFGQVQLLGGQTLTTVQPIQMDDNDTFFAVSYGGGVKSIRLWGPLGLRADVRGRTLPNYYGGSPTWLEVTGGVNFMWGER